MHVEGLKGVRGATGKRTGNREHGEGVSRFSLSFFFFFSLSLLFRVKPAGTWDSSASCDWLTMRWNDGVRILKGLLWLADAEAHTHSSSAHKSCMWAVYAKKKHTHTHTYENPQINMKCTHWIYMHAHKNTHNDTYVKTAQLHLI